MKITVHASKKSAFRLILLWQKAQLFYEIICAAASGGMEIKMKILVINGPNINMLGIREPEIYGRETYAELCRRVEFFAAERGIEAEIYQSNHEGALVDRIQAAYFEGVDGIVINPGAYTHTSVALRDALAAVKIPTVEVHISAVEKREAFRQISYVRDECIATVTGKGLDGYIEAIEILMKK